MPARGRFWNIVAAAALVVTAGCGGGPTQRETAGPGAGGQARVHGSPGDASARVRDLRAAVVGTWLPCGRWGRTPLTFQANGSVTGGGFAGVRWAMTAPGTIDISDSMTTVRYSLDEEALQAARRLVLTHTEHHRRVSCAFTRCHIDKDPVLRRQRRCEVSTRPHGRPRPAPAEDERVLGPGSPRRFQVPPLSVECG